MQSTDIFTVGGSIAVNAHGMDHRAGAVGKTIRSMRVMLADGSIQRVSRTENPELFNLVVGGYGLFGIVLDVQLDITDNEIYETSRDVID
jgi:FAD/FMN-containing dehydrogenase